MSYLEKTAFDAYQNFLAHQQSVEEAIGFKVSTKATHPVVLAFLYLCFATDVQRNQNHHFSKLLALTFNDKVVSKDNKALFSFIEREQAKEQRKLVVLCPSDELVGDLAHTKLPAGTRESIDNYLKENIVFVEFPQSSTEKGVFVSAELVDGLSRSAFTGTSRRFSEIEKQVQENPNKFQDELSTLVDMIILYHLSSNAKEERQAQLTTKEFLSIKNKSKLKAKLKKQGLVPRYLLLPPEKNWRGAKEGRSWELTKTIEVRGHWRWHACGVGQLDHKLIWIAAHQKGLNYKI